MRPAAISSMLLWVLLGAGAGEVVAAAASAQQVPAEAELPEEDVVAGTVGSGDGSGDVDDRQPSPWYLERGTERRKPSAQDDVPDVTFQLAALLRDGGIPGFYDGQFGSVKDRFEDLARVAQDGSMHHTIRIMAVMALQEAADGERLLQALAPLLIDPEVEFDVELTRAQRDFDRTPPRPLDEQTHRRELDVDLSRYTRFALAKDGQPRQILERIHVLENYVLPRRVELLDPLIRTFRNFKIYYGRAVWFEIGYHYQQFDDYVTAAEWFRQLTQSLKGSDIRMAHYNLACIAALTGRPEEAVAELRRAADAGFLDVAWMDEDGDLETVREREDYQALRRQLLGEDPEPATKSPADEAAGSPDR